MKKIYTLIVLIVAGVAVANAQRNVDWSLDAILEPTEINSGDSSTTLTFTFVCKNLGPDAALAGDTVLVQMRILNEQGTVIAAAPNVTSFYFDILDKTLNTGDTVHFSRTVLFNAYAASSINVTMRGYTFLIGPGLADETTPGTNNNAKDRAMVWYNSKGWGVSVSDVASSSEFFTVYPNPASDVLNLNWQLVFTGNEDATVKIYSLEGKLVKSVVLSGFGHEQISLSDLDNGMYLVEFESGSIKSTQKVQVSK